VGNLVLLVYVVVDDPFSLVWCAGLLALGGALYLAEYFFGRPEPDQLANREA
jgi:APA family basic amino acid/polyamine antiporter